MDARPKETPFHLGTAVKEKDLSKMNANNGPIRALPSRVANHIRASQVIGSIEQGVEELIQNAIIHGAARTVTVTVGTNNSNDVVIVIEDDGVGIENEAMRMLIGTEACCTTDNAVFGNQGRGDSLRSVAALCGETKIESTYMSTKGIVYSTKIIKNGVTVFFEDSASVCSIIPTVRSVRKTGMRITLNNMFQQFAVRRKQHRSEDLLASIRSMMSLLSLAYPLISFKLLSDGETGKVDSIFDPPKFSKEFLGALTCRVLHSGPMSVSLDDEVSALVERMLADGASSGRSIQLVGEDGDEFRLFGVIFLNEVRLDKKNCRKIQIFVNGRPAVQAKNLTEVIHYRIKKHFGDDSYTTSGFIHIVAKESETSNMGKMSAFLTTIVSKAIADERSDKNKRKHTEADSKIDDNRHSRIVKGQYITTTTSHERSSSHQNSPFTNIFCDAIPQPYPEDINGNISFDEAFLDENSVKDMDISFDDIEEAVPSTSWTKHRIKALHSTIAELNPTGTQSNKISFTKEMLSSAEVISQLDSSFILIKMGCLICAVDQHAADERVSLETLENALMNCDSHDGMKISLTKRQLQVGDILKSCQVVPSRSVVLTTSQMTTARHYHSLLQKWKFSFEEESNAEEKRIIILRGLPSVCGRIAQVDDFLQYLNDLGTFAGGSSIKPKFVSRILASNACRYATMFGDELSLRQCKNLIDALAKCQLPFVCAHGRPSIIPLIDNSSHRDDSNAAVSSGNNKNDSNVYLEQYQRWGSKRVIRR